MNTEPENSGKKEDGVTFDMYRFFSRKDVIAAALAILALLAWLAFRVLKGTHGV